MDNKLPKFLIQFCGFGNFKKSLSYYQTTVFPRLAIKSDAGLWLCVLLLSVP